MTDPFFRGRASNEDQDYSQQVVWHQPQVPAIRKTMKISRGPSGSRKHRSKHRGVSWISRLKKWKAQIEHKGKREYLGYFVEEKDAALAYNKRALELRGEEAYQNDVGDEDAEQLELSD